MKHVLPNDSRVAVVVWQHTTGFIYSGKVNINDPIGGPCVENGTGNVEFAIVTCNTIDLLF